MSRETAQEKRLFPAMFFSGNSILTTVTTSDWSKIGGLTLKKLLMIPCCATKKFGGSSQSTASEPLEHLVSERVYSGILEARRDMLLQVRQIEKYMSGRKYEKNQCLKSGPDFGGQHASGLYLPAVKRYKGRLYSNAPTLLSRSRPDDMHILILSALYGPLHPLSHIQDYNLMMSDAPACRVWKKSFEPFLRCYVLLKGIQEIHLFFGSSTSYLEVARAAVKPLLRDKVINKAIQYHVKDGSSSVTPTTHGELLEKFLRQGEIKDLPENVKVRAL